MPKSPPKSPIHFIKHFFKKKINTALTPPKMKQNLLRIFISFVKLLNISLDEYSLFPGHVKSVFLKINDSERAEKTVMVVISRKIIYNSVQLQISDCASSDLEKD